jgi:hypothetical protein
MFGAYLDGYSTVGALNFVVEIIKLAEGKTEFGNEESVSTITSHHAPDILSRYSA